MPRQSSRPYGRGSARGLDEGTSENVPGWDGTIDPRILIAPGAPATTESVFHYAPPLLLSHTHYQNYPSINSNTEGDTQEYATSSLDYVNSTSTSPETGFGAVAGQNLEFHPDNSGFGAPGIDQYRNNQLDDFSTTSES